MNLEELNKQFENEKNKKSEKEENTEKKGKKKWLILLLLVIILGTALIFAKYKMQSSSLPEEDKIETAQGKLIDEIPEGMTEGEYGELLQKQIDDSMFTINAKTTPIFQNGNSKGVIDITNNPSNKFPCKVSLKLSDSGEEVYRCDDLIYPGQYINEIKLTKNLKKGAYPATLTYYVFDEKGEEAIGTVNAGINIAIQN